MPLNIASTMGTCEYLVWAYTWFGGHISMEKVGMHLIEYGKIIRWPSWTVSNLKIRVEIEIETKPYDLLWMSYLAFQKRNVADYEIESEWAIEWLSFTCRHSGASSSCVDNTTRREKFRRSILQAFRFSSCVDSEGETSTRSIQDKTGISWIFIYVIVNVTAESR